MRVECVLILLFVMMVSPKSAARRRRVTTTLSSSPSAVAAKKKKSSQSAATKRRNKRSTISSSSSSNKINRRQQKVSAHRHHYAAAPSSSWSGKVKVASCFPDTVSAMKWCTAMAKRLRAFYAAAASSSPPCIVLDIDDTIVRSDDGSPISSIILFAHKAAVEYGYLLYLVTARPEYRENREWTVKQLEGLGFYKSGSRPSNSVMRHRRAIPYVDLYMHSQNNTEEINQYGFSKYKYICRTRKTRGPVLINIGDQWDDLIVRPPVTHEHAKVHKDVYNVHASGALRYNKKKCVLVGINISPCSLISVKLPDNASP